MWGILNSSLFVDVHIMPLNCTQPTWFLFCTVPKCTQWLRVMHPPKCSVKWKAHRSMRLCAASRTSQDTGSALWIGGDCAASPYCVFLSAAAFLSWMEFHLSSLTRRVVETALCDAEATKVSEMLWDVLNFFLQIIIIINNFRLHFDWHLGLPSSGHRILFLA